MGTGQKSKSKLSYRMIPPGRHGGGKIRIVESPTSVKVTLAPKSGGLPTTFTTDKATSQTTIIKEATKLKLASKSTSDNIQASLRNQELTRRENIPTSIKEQADPDYWKTEIKDRALALQGKTKEETVKNIKQYVYNKINHTLYSYPRKIKKAWGDNKGDCTERANIMKLMLEANDIEARKVYGYDSEGRKHDQIEYKTKTGFELLEKGKFEMKGLGLWVEGGNSKKQQQLKSLINLKLKTPKINLNQKFILNIKNPKLDIKKLMKGLI